MYTLILIGEWISPISLAESMPQSLQRFMGKCDHKVLKNEEMATFLWKSLKCDQNCDEAGSGTHTKLWVILTSGSVDIAFTRSGERRRRRWLSTEHIHASRGCIIIFTPCLAFTFGWLWMIMVMPTFLCYLKWHGLTSGRTQNYML